MKTTTPLAALFATVVINVLAVGGMSVDSRVATQNSRTDELERRSEAVAATTKRGVIYTDSSAASLSGFGSKVTWAFDFASTPGSLPSNKFEFAPILFSTDSGDTNPWSTNAQTAINNGATHLLGFNEPDLSGISPQDAAFAWMEFMQPFASQAQLCSPAVVASDSGGIPWLEEFISACTGCTIDCIAFHIDEFPATEFTTFESIVTQVRNQFNRPMWLTEFEATGSASDVETFLQRALAFLDSFSEIQRYAYFEAGNGILSNSDGSLTALGQIYNAD